MTAREVLDRFPAGTSVLGETSGLLGVVLRHERGRVVVQWDNGHTVAKDPRDLRPGDEEPPRAPRTARERIVAAARDAGWVGDLDEPHLSVLEFRPSEGSRKYLRVYFSVTGAVISGNRGYTSPGHRRLPTRGKAQAALDLIAGKPYVREA
jgi:hypothetical protein